MLTHPGGRTFGWLWLAQSVSIFGSEMSGIALGVWLFQRTGQATPLALTALFTFLPAVLLAPLAGVLVDRMDRRRVMFLADLVQAAGTLFLWSLYASGQLEPWVLYGVVALSSAAKSFQLPAQSAAVSLLVPKEQLSRANGLLAASSGVGEFAGPLFAGALVAALGVGAVLLVDLATFVFSALVLLFVRIPRPPKSEAGEAGRGSLLAEARAGWRAIAAHPGLVGLLALAAAANFTILSTIVLYTPLVLARSADPGALGLVYSAYGLGFLAGGALMATWGGTRPRVNAVLGGYMLTGLLGQVAFGFSPGLPLWLLSIFAYALLIPVRNASAQAIWQTKIEPDLQGRVFALRLAVSQSTAPLAFLLAGPLADLVFDPLGRGGLGTALAPLLGDEAGRGYALMYVAFGLLTVLVGLAGFLRPRVRRVEAEVPDVRAAAD